jgi:glycosyltransferase involved in cell wall biosynthesis
LIKIKKLSRPWNLIRAWWSIYLTIKNQKLDILICHEIWNYVLAYLPAKLSGTPVVLWCHTTSFGYRLYRLLRFLTPAHLIANSQHVQVLMQENWPDYAIDYLYCPHPDFSPPLESRVANAIPVILYVGRMADYKGPKILLKSLTLMQDVAFHLKIVGGPQSPGEQIFFDELKEFVKANKLESKVDFMGEQRNVSTFYANADLFCHPNIYSEAFGLVFIEALYAGLPVIATDIGGAKEIFSSSSFKPGKLVAPNDHVVLAQALREFINNPALREQIKTHAKSIAANLCQPDKAMLRYQQLVLKICGFKN